MCTSHTLDDFGGWRIIEPNCNAVVAGARFDLDLDDVEEQLNRLSESA